MGFFGRIGIDWRLIAAQIVNFAILLWFLRRFLYKPLLKGMEHSELEEAEKQMEMVRQGQAQLKKERDQELNDMKRKSSELVEAAEKVAERIREEAKHRAEEDQRKILAQAESLMKSQKDAAAKAKESQMKRDLSSAFAKSWSDRLADEDRAKFMQGVYFDELLAALEAVPDADIARAGGEIVLTGARAAGKKETDELRKRLAARLKGWEGTLKTRRDKDLIAGFRLELDGLQVETNLLADIRHAAEGR